MNTWDALYSEIVNLRAEVQKLKSGEALRNSPATSTVKAYPVLVGTGYRCSRCGVGCYNDGDGSDVSLMCSCNAAEDAQVQGRGREI